MKENDKAKFDRTASNNNGTARINIPNEIAQHLNIQPGDTIRLQTEYSQEHGEYASFWNQTKQKQNTEEK